MKSGMAYCQVPDDLKWVAQAKTPWVPSELKAAAESLAKAPAGVDEEELVAEFKEARRRGKR